MPYKFILVLSLCLATIALKAETHDASIIIIPASVCVVTATNADIFYHQNETPTGLGKIPSGTEITVDAVKGERCFFIFNGKPAYIQRQFLRTKAELDAERERIRQAQEEFRKKQEAIQLVREQQQENERQKKAELEEQKRKEFELEKRAKQEQQVRQEEARIQVQKEREATLLKEQAQFEASQIAKGLVKHGGQWMTRKEMQKQVLSSLYQDQDATTRQLAGIKKEIDRINAIHLPQWNGSIPWMQYVEKQNNLEETNRSLISPLLIKKTDLERHLKEIDDYKLSLIQMEISEMRADINSKLPILVTPPTIENTKTRLSAVIALQKKIKTETHPVVVDTTFGFAITKYTENTDKLDAQWRELDLERCRLEDKLAELGDKEYRVISIERHKRYDPRYVAEQRVVALTENGVVKSSQYINTLPGINDMCSVVYQLDYITTSGLRREGQYVFQMKRSPTGEWFIFYDKGF